MVARLALAPGLCHWINAIIMSYLIEPVEIIFSRILAMIFTGSAEDAASHQAVGEKDNNQMHVWNVMAYVNSCADCDKSIFVSF